MAQPRFGDSGTPPLGYFGRLRHQPPVWLESRAPFESLRLRRHPVFTSDGLPRGQGQPVLLVPGFMAGDRSLATFQGWLLRLGYHAVPAGFALNVRFSEAELQTLLLTLVDLYSWLGQPVTVVGHSRGGLLAKVAAHRHPEMVAQVIALGSPLADPYDVHPLTMVGVRLAQAYNLVRFGQTGEVERRFLTDLAAPARVPLISIYSRTDGIVHWTACLRPDAHAIEVEGSHAGLAVNPAVYGLVARALASGRRRSPRSG